MYEKLIESRLNSIAKIDVEINNVVADPAYAMSRVLKSVVRTKERRREVLQKDVEELRKLEAARQPELPGVKKGSK